MEVSVIIVNYNTRLLLADCLKSLYRQTKDVEFEVIVVDNASHDGSKDYVTEKFPQVTWIDSGGNIGFGRANNLGAANAHGKYLFLLNSDTILLNNAIKMFRDYAETHIDERIGVLGSWLLDINQKPNVSHGRFPSPINEVAYLFDRIYRRLHTPRQKGVRNVDYVIGADMFVRKDVFLQLEGFDKNIFMYYEETDLQLRMEMENYLRRIIDGPRIIHFDGGSFENKGLTYNRFMLSQKSCNYYINKHYRGLGFLWLYLSICFTRLLMLLILTNKWSAKERLEACKAVLFYKQYK